MNSNYSNDAVNAAAQERRAMQRFPLILLALFLLAILAGSL